jgi:hypothetical protein
MARLWVLEQTDPNDRIIERIRFIGANGSAKQRSSR